MILASHNTFSYLPIKQWYMKPLRFMVRCQSKTEREQFNYGARYFDIRIAFHKGKPYFSHGLATFKGDVMEHLNTLDLLAKGVHEDIWVRVLKERNKDSNKEFINFCETIKEKFKHLKFTGGENKKDWKLIYPFTWTNVEAKFSSCNNDIPGRPATGTYLDDLTPWIYARRNNKKWLEHYKNENSTLMIDFIGKYGFKTHTSLCGEIGKLG